MPYNAQKQLITWPVGNYDVQRAIGNSSPDIAVLMQANTINKWATFKPHPYGTVVGIGVDGSAPFGVRTLYRNINPSSGAMGATTTLQQAIEALSSPSNLFYNDLAIRIPPSGGTNRAFRLTDFVSTQHVRAPGEQRGIQSIHGYVHNASEQFGCYDNLGVYYGINRAIGIDSDGYIVADSNQSIDGDIINIMANYPRLETRLTYGRDIDNNLCILDWLEDMFALSSEVVLHRGIVLWTTDAGSDEYYYAVQTIPWAAQSPSIADHIKGLTGAKWHCVEFLTTRDINTSTDFQLLSNWSYNSNLKDWMFIPGFIYHDLYVGNNNPYNVGAYFIRAEVSPYINKFNLQMRVTNLGANSSVSVFLSSSPNPGSPVDMLNNSYKTVSATGDVYLYGAANSGITMYPSDSQQSTGRFDQVFTVGNTYYLHIWGKLNPSDSSQTVIWTQPLVAMASDMLIPAT